MTGIEKVARRSRPHWCWRCSHRSAPWPAPPPRPAPLPDCSRSWAAPVSGSWSDPTKWTGGIVPLPTDHVCIFGAATFTVTVAGPGTVEVASLRMGEHGGTHTQELAVVPGVTPTTTLLAHEEIDVGKHGLLTLGSPAGGPGTVAVRTDPDGTFDVFGEVSAPADSGTQDTTLELATGQLRFYANHPSFPPPGTLRVERPLSITADQILIDGVVDLSAPLDVEVATRLWLSGGTISTAGPTAGNPVVTVDGTLRVGGFSVEGTDWETGQFLVTDGGAVELNGEAEVGVAIEGEVAVSGTVREQTRLLVNGRADGTEAHARFSDTFTNEGEIVLGDDAGDTSQASLGTDGAGTFVNEGHVLVRRFAGGPGRVSRILADVTTAGTSSSTTRSMSRGPPQRGRHRPRHRRSGGRAGERRARPPRSSPTSTPAVGGVEPESAGPRPGPAEVAVTGSLRSTPTRRSCRNRGQRPGDHRRRPHGTYDDVHSRAPASYDTT